MSDALELSATEFVAAAVVADGLASGEWEGVTRLARSGDAASARLALEVLADYDLDRLIDLTIDALQPRPAGSTPAPAARAAITHGREVRVRARELQAAAQATRRVAAAERSRRR